MSTKDSNNSSPRVMWLLNHSSARRFEVAMLKKLGITEIFLPKSVPCDPRFRSASIDFSEDAHLTIPLDELALLNATDWYATPSKRAWEIANKYFDVLFFVLLEEQCFTAMVKNFHGSIIYRAYGAIKESTNYANILRSLTDGKGEYLIKQLGTRFWYAYAYANQIIDEQGVLCERGLFLPLGLADTSIHSDWTGLDKRIFFVCPDIGLIPYYKSIYQKFINDFKQFSYVVAGTQSISVANPNVLGYLSKEAHEHNMHSMRVMFYHSDEPKHIHYHPFEAIRAGMPLVFMAHGMLDYLGGINLPGRCKTIAEARQKIARILNDDWQFIDKIRTSQSILLELMKPSQCEEHWRRGMQTVLDHNVQAKTVALNPQSPKTTRIAVILPVAYRGGSLRGAKLLAQALLMGGQQANADIEVVFAYLENANYSQEDLNDLPAAIKCRAYHWQKMNYQQAYCAMTCAGMEYPLDSNSYQIPDDGMRQFMDCDLWVVVSDRLQLPLLPIKPYILMIYDYLQRYESFLNHSLSQSFISAAHRAQGVWVTTEFTKQDAIHFAGIPPLKIHKLPMLAPEFSATNSINDLEVKPYFIWTTNLGLHKNHLNAIRALEIYYEEYQGQFACVITGVGTENLMTSTLEHLKPLGKIWDNSVLLRSKLKIMSELPEKAYQKLLSGAQFLWHAGRVDNGTFSVIEAAYLGVPALSSDYPAMQEINTQFDLNLSWMNATNPHHMAQQLKNMESEIEELREQLPSPARLNTQNVPQLAPFYWRALEEYL